MLFLRVSLSTQLKRVLRLKKAHPVVGTRWLFAKCVPKAVRVGKDVLG